MYDSRGDRSDYVRSSRDEREGARGPGKEGRGNVKGRTIEPVSICEMIVHVSKWAMPERYEMKWNLPLGEKGIKNHAHTLVGLDTT